MIKKLIAIIAFATMMSAGTASAISIDPDVGLVDFDAIVFNGPGQNVTFDGNDTFDITLTEEAIFAIHFEDSGQPVDEFDLLLDGNVVAFDSVQLGDGVPNGAAVLGELGGPNGVFEALVTLTLGPGTHVFDLIQIFGIPGDDAFLNVTPVSPTGVSAVPLPAAGWMLIAGIGGLVVMRRRKQAV